MALSRHFQVVEYGEPDPASVSLRHRATQYLELYKLRQQAASARGLLGKRPAKGETLLQATDAVNGADDDDVLVAKVHYNQDRALELLSMLQKRLTALEIDLKEKRSFVFVRSLLCGAIGAALSSSLLL